MSAGADAARIDSAIALDDDACACGAAGGGGCGGLCAAAGETARRDKGKGKAPEPQVADIVSEVPFEIALRIAYWLLPKHVENGGLRDLMEFGAACRYFRLVAYDESVWREAYARLLIGKQLAPHCPPPAQLHHLCSFAARPHLIERMTDHELRVFCIERHNRRLVVIPDVPFGIPLPTDPDAPPSDRDRPRRRFLASDVRPQDTPDSFFLPPDVTNVPSAISHLARSDLVELATRRVYLSPAIPDALPFASRFQLAYATALRDARRTFLTEHELVNMRWSVRFRDSSWFGWGSGGRVWARHERGGGMQLGDMLFHWRFLGDPDGEVRPSFPPARGPSHRVHGAGYVSAERARWKNADILNRRRLVQCERYAPKTVRRTPDWGWTLKNPNVKYTSLSQEDPPASSSSGPGQPGAPTPAPTPTPTLAMAPAAAQQLVAILTSPLGYGFVQMGGQEEEEEEEEDDDGEMAEEDDMSDQERDDEETRILQEHRWIAGSAFGSD
ncbi:hypothetical protein DFJ74DRAFT_756951 [Hyaloraphidium curvatum]|nr:hypothetical protein DFJ74DRAFT_756951 [Hyaloraphidium curvatum]